MIVNNDYSVVKKFGASLTDIIYDRHMFMVQATGEIILNLQILFKFL